MDPKPPPPSHSSSFYASFPIVVISILGILTTAILLLSYYIFVIKCCLNWRRPHLLLFHRFSSRSRRQPIINNAHQTENHGLNASAINSIPTLRFSKTTTSSVECAVCLAEFHHDELLRLLPNCSHAFHIDCIDTWLQSNANCPLCRAEISSSSLQIQQFTASPSPQPTEQDSGLVIEIRDCSTSEQSPIKPAEPKSPTKTKKFWQMASRGDECIDIREKDERFAVLPIRRSFSMDSSNDRQLYVSVQEILRQNPHLFPEVRNGEGASSSGAGGGEGNGSGRIRRSFFSFGRSSRSAASVLPVQSENESELL